MGALEFILSVTGLADKEYLALKGHVLDRIKNTETGKQPFYHLYIDEVFPEGFYAELHAVMRDKKSPEKMQDRKQDNAAFVNRRFPLRDCPERPVKLFARLFEDADVKAALASKFYAQVTSDFVRKVSIHRKEFEFVFCEPDRFQNIHVDIPPKYMSFVFYLPDTEVSEDAEKRNATVLYDRDLNPVYGARFRRNSVCIFVPHFYSYHGFSTTIDRDVLVMFYINKDAMKIWNQGRGNNDEGPQFEWLLDQIETKLQSTPLLEYGDDPERIKTERAACRINAPQGRVMID